MPITESKSLRKPLGIFSEGDYYHFKRFETQLSDHLKQHANDPSHDAADVRMLLTEHFRFSSKCEAGLELVDVLTNATRRALSGRLVVEGWRNLPSLDRKRVV